MAFSSSWLAATLALFSFLSLLLPANALYFYVDGRQPKCFFEDLPKDTLVAGTDLWQLQLIHLRFPGDTFWANTAVLE